MKQVKAVLVKMSNPFILMMSAGEQSIQVNEMHLLKGHQHKTWVFKGVGGGHFSAADLRQEFALPFTSTDLKGTASKRNYPFFSYFDSGHDALTRGDKLRPWN